MGAPGAGQCVCQRPGGAGYPLKVDQNPTPLRRILVTADMILAVVALVAVAIYAGAFLMPAPMMQ